MSYNNIGIIGGGAWGTALAQTCARAGRSVTVWAREDDTVSNINEERQNKVFLPNIRLDEAITATTDLQAIASSDAILIVCPTQHVRTIISQLAPALPPEIPLINCAKGIEQQSGKLISAVLSETAPQARLAILSGPSFAADVAKDLPTAITLACDNESLGRDLAHALGHKNFRPYWTADLIGAQIGGAIKNVLAIAAGIVAGKQLGESAKAALVTRGFAELTRFGLAHGAKAETLAGLSGLGDLILTCATPQSRNMSLGKALGKGINFNDYLADKKSVAEGALTAPAVVKVASEKNIEMPICAAVNAVISGDTLVDEAISALLARPFKAET